MFFVTHDSSGEIVGKYKASDSNLMAIYSNTVIVDANSFDRLEAANKITSGALVAKAVTSISVASSIFLADGVSVCSIQISPISYSCLVKVSNFSSIFTVTSADPYLFITSTVPKQFEVKIHNDLNHYAPPVTVKAT